MRAYENKYRGRSRRDGDVSAVSSFAARWGENAWRLASLLHLTECASSGDLPSITGETAESAVALMRWYAGEQLCLLQEVRDQRFPDRVDRICEALERNGGRMTLGDLNDRLNITQSEARRLASIFPNCICVVEDQREGSGKKAHELVLVKQ